MTCGIYKLNFNGTNKTYIGQSVNIEKRYLQHLLNLRDYKANNKLQEAYKKYGKPELEILSECTIEELDIQEDECIEIWDSVNNGFNIYYTANEAPTYKGFGGGNSKYSKDQIIKTFDLLVDTSKSFKEIEEIVGVSFSSVAAIACLVHHVWLREEFPDKYSILVSKVGNRENYNIVSDKLSAKARGIQYPPIKSPEGQVYTIENAYKFAKERGLAPNHFQEVLNGHRKSHKGWKLCPVEPVL